MIAMNSNVKSATIKMNKKTANTLILTKRNSGQSTSYEVGIDFVRNPWPKLQSLIIQDVQDQDCMFLSSIQMPIIATIEFRSCNFGEKGCKPIGQADWSNLKSVTIDNPKLKDIGCYYLCKANWTRLKYINFKNCQIGDQGLEYISQANWPNLTNFTFSKLGYSDRIRDDGCKHISSAKWENLECLNLGGQLIGDWGIANLCEAEWPNLKHLTLNIYMNNQLGCSFFALNFWQNLLYLRLDNCKIGTIGCAYINRADWPILQNMSLCKSSPDEEKNNIENQGCMHLSKANWKNLSQVNLLKNHGINYQGLRILGRSQWPLLKNLFIYGYGGRRYMDIRKFDVLFSQKKITVS